MESPPARTIRVVSAVIERGGRYLITQRRATAVLPLLWEFPGGRVEPAETDAAALEREVADLWARLVREAAARRGDHPS